jgi:hypothetical protein
MSISSKRSALIIQAFRCIFKAYGKQRLRNTFRKFASQHRNDCTPVFAPRRIAATGLAAQYIQAVFELIGIAVDSTHRKGARSEAAQYLQQLPEGGAPYLLHQSIAAFAYNHWCTLIDEGTVAAASQLV